MGDRGTLVAPHLGAILAFDEARGIGTVRGDDGATLGFHCTQIADGSRTIRVGTRVRYELAASPLGVWEATGVDPVA